MTIRDAISQVKDLRTNTGSASMLIHWLSELDGKVKLDIIDTHNGGEDILFAPYADDVDRDTVLLIPAPYESVYLWWLAAQIDLANREIKSYNLSISKYNEEYQAFANFYNRTHMPKSSGRFIF
jgi:hypothetical protein